jgi:3-dehydroquinate synthase
VASPVAEPLVVQSHAGAYRVEFADEPLPSFQDLPGNPHLIVDKRVASLHADALAAVLDSYPALRIEASEGAKSLEQFRGYVEALVAGGIRRGDVIVAVGGGVIQDIACFLAATLMRGLEWWFLPTTLLAQADSCIGSKSSINVGELKNLLGTFTPPARVHVWAGYLETLEEPDVRSGIGEMLKVHAIEAPDSFDRIARDYGLLFEDAGVMRRYVRASLEIKRRIIEEDEFDRGPRNVMNYGHSFGHAIESATRFEIPHGIAITIGMDMANFVSMRLGPGTAETYERMRSVLAANAAGYGAVAIGSGAVVEAIGKDKKNVGSELRLVLPDGAGRIGLVRRPNDEAFRAVCDEYLREMRPR